MGDLEAELARFEAELASVARPGPAAPPVLPPPTLPPPRLPPPGHGPPHSGAGPQYPRVMHPQHVGMPPPLMMPPPMMPPPLAMPPSQPYAAARPHQPYAAAQPPQQPLSYGSGGAPNLYSAPTVYSAPAVVAPPPAAPPAAAEPAKKQKGQERVAIVRQAAGARWADPTLIDWPENDFRIFVGNLGNEVSDALLTSAFSKYSSFNKAKVVRFSHNNKTKGYGFVSLADNEEGAKALREMQGKYIGNRPVQVKRSNWDERNVVDKRTGKAKKRQIVVKDKPNPNKRQAGGAGILHR